jgi:pyruvate/2-oxoglutarate dehydrogenase complex dihydrolipoamide acyltransferase (E2) component
VQLGFDLVGRISDVVVDEGDRVTLGQVVAHLAPEQLTADARAARTAIDESMLTDLREGMPADVALLGDADSPLRRTVGCPRSGISETTSSASRSSGCRFPRIEARISRSPKVALSGKPTVSSSPTRRSALASARLLEQAWVTAALGYGIALAIGSEAFPHFPRRVVLTETSVVGVGLLLLGVSTLASVAGVVYALRIDPGPVLES